MLSVARRGEARRGKIRQGEGLQEDAERGEARRVKASKLKVENGQASKSEVRWVSKEIKLILRKRSIQIQINDKKS